MSNLSKIQFEVEVPKPEGYSALVASEEDIKVGSLFFGGYDDKLFIISEIKEIKNKNEKPYDYVYLKYYDIETREEEHHHCHGMEKQKFIKEYSDKFIPDLDKYLSLAEDYLFNGKEIEEEKKVEDTQALVHKTNKQVLVSMHGSIELKRKHLELIRSMAAVKIAAQKNKLEAIKRKMDEKLAVFTKEMRKIQRVIGMIELYLGIEEELHQLQEGNPASIDTPLSLRQLTLYADEELGNCEDGGIDYTQLHLFDKWLLKDKNYNILLPEERGIVAIKPRRRDKHYSDNHFENSLKNRWNHETYFLIRNGENIYRICSPNISVGRTMFPLKNEFSDLMNKIEKEDEDRWPHIKKNLEEKKEHMTNVYLTTILFIQGLIDRTEVFYPIHPGVKVTEMQDDGRINLIYDAEMGLPDGRLSFKQWREKINENVGRGSRIILVPDRSDRGKGYSNTDEGFYKYYDRYTPQLPERGIYTVEEKKSEDRGGITVPVIKYLPGDEVWKRDSHGGWGGFEERKRRVSWVINYNYSWYLNYDRVSLDDINFYLNSRIERENYLDILPLLRELKKHLIEEQKREEDFKLMLKGVILSKGSFSEKKVDNEIQKALDWWKFKNIWKRPITQDDAKACRMIQSRVLRKLKLEE